MNRLPPLLCAALALTLPLLLARASEAVPSAAPSAGSPAPDAAASSSASAPALPPLSEVALGDAHTPVPSVKEWAAGTRYRPVEGAEGCSLTVVREWLSVRCEIFTSEIALVAGQGDGVAFWLTPVPASTSPEKSSMESPAARFCPTMTAYTGAPECPFALSSQIVLPLRRGDRRVFELRPIAVTDFGGFHTFGQLVVFSEYWLGDARSPTLVAQPVEPDPEIPPLPYSP